MNCYLCKQQICAGHKTNIDNKPVVLCITCHKQQDNDFEIECKNVKQNNKPCNNCGLCKNKQLED